MLDSDIEEQLNSLSDLITIIGVSISKKENQNAKDLGHLVVALDCAAASVASIQLCLKGGAAPKRKTEEKRRTGISHLR